MSSMSSNLTVEIDFQFSECEKSRMNLSLPIMHRTFVSKYCFLPNIFIQKGSGLVSFFFFFNLTQIQSDWITLDCTPLHDSSGKC